MATSVDFSIANVFIVRTVSKVNCLVRSQGNFFCPVLLSD